MHIDFMKLLLNILGILLILGIVYLLSWKRKSVNFKLVLKALLVQFIIAFILVKIPAGRFIVSKVSDFVSGVISCGNAGLSFVFGSLADSSQPTGMIFAIQVLGNIIFLSALVSFLYYIGVLGFVVKLIGKAVCKLMGTSEVESFVAVANMFLGHTDSPVLVSKYLPTMTDSEIMVVLVSGMGSMSVSILGGYTALGIPMEYLLIGSALVPVGSILVSKMILPQTDKVKEVSSITMDNKGAHSNAIDAIADGAVTGVQMVLSIGASLIAVIAMVTLINKIIGFAGVTLEQLFSYLFAPVGFFMGLDPSEILMEGSLLGNKLVLNEFVSFQQLGEVIRNMDPRTGLICTISLCGFANFSSLGMCVSGISVLCPEKKGTLARLVFRSMIGGVLVSILSAMVVGLIALL